MIVTLYTISGLITFFFLFWAILWFRNGSKIQFLQSVTAELSETSPPKVSIIFTARDEEEDVGSAAFSFINQSYPNIEVIAVNDRSQDRTASILHHMALSHKQFKVKDIASLPKNWLGKTHGLWQAYKESSGDYLLFTDADVKFHQNTVSQAMNHVLANNLDHLTLFPDLNDKNPIEKALLWCFLFVSSVVAPPWKIKDTSHTSAIGIGAFNLVKKSTYEKIGTHKSFPLAVIDDVELGRRIKKEGFTSDLLVGLNRVVLRWHNGLLGVVRGLEKNFFPAMNYSLAATLFSVVNLLILSCLPVAGYFVEDGVLLSTSLVNTVLLFVIFVKSRSLQRTPLYSFLFIPIGFIFLSWALLSSAMITLMRGGINWRQTHYPLDTLEEAETKSGLDALLGRY